MNFKKIIQDNIGIVLMLFYFKGRKNLLHSKFIDKSLTTAQYI